MLKGRRIVLVEDDEIMGASIAQRLDLEGAEVHWVKQVVRAIPAVRTPRAPVDAVICDIRMPKINGVQAIEYFKKQFPHVPIIVLTAYPEAEMAVSFMRSGVVDYLVKPVEAQKLTAAVKRAMEQRQLTWA